MSCGALDGRSDRAEISHPLGAQLLWDHSYAQRHQSFADRVALAVRD